MTDWEITFIMAHRVARFATVDEQGQPHILPIVYAFDGTSFFTPIDHKPKRVPATQLRRVRNIAANPQVAMVIDDYNENWQQLAWVQIRGRAEIVSAGTTYRQGIQLLSAKYPQYQRRPLGDQPLITVMPLLVRSWRANR